MHITLVTSPVTAEEIQSTIGIDQVIWYCTKSKDVSDTIGITFYVWDFAGQVGGYIYDNGVTIYTLAVYRRNTQPLISVLSLTILSMCCVGGHVMEKMAFMN